MFNWPLKANFSWVCVCRMVWVVRFMLSKWSDTHFWCKLCWTVYWIMIYGMWQHALKSLKRTLLPAAHHSNGMRLNGRNNWNSMKMSKPFGNWFDMEQRLWERYSRSGYWNEVMCFHSNESSKRNKMGISIGLNQVKWIYSIASFVLQIMQ